MNITAPGLYPNSSWVTFSNDKTIHRRVTFLDGLAGGDNRRINSTPPAIYIMRNQVRKNPIPAVTKYKLSSIKKPPHTINIAR